MGKQRGKALLMVRTDVKPEGEGAFNDWYTNVHLPEILEVPGIRWGRRYKLSGSETYPASADDLTYLAIYELDDESVLDGPEFARAKGWGPGIEEFPQRTTVSVYSLIAAAEQQ